MPPALTPEEALARLQTLALIEIQASKCETFFDDRYVMNKTMTKLVWSMVVGTVVMVAAIVTMTASITGAFKDIQANARIANETTIEQGKTIATIKGKVEYEHDCVKDLDKKLEIHISQRK
jgi:hypothetical protein